MAMVRIRYLRYLNLDSKGACHRYALRFVLSSVVLLMLPQQQTHAGRGDVKSKLHICLLHYVQVYRGGRIKPELLPSPVRTLSDNQSGDSGDVR